jgi:hypothetical protein
MADKPDALPEPSDAAPAAKKSGDFLKTYVWVMAALALFLGWLVWKKHDEKAAFERANAEAPRVFGEATLPASEIERPTTIRALAVGILKYLSSVKDMPKGATDTAIPVAGIRRIAEGLGLQIRVFSPEQTEPKRAKGYEEISTTIQLEPTDLDRLAKFLYNVEATSTKVRVLDVRWDLKSDRENPYPPGNAATNITVKVGFRRPISRSAG